MSDRKPALKFIFITLVLDLLGIGIIVPILPALVKEMNGDMQGATLTYGILLSVYSLMQFLFAPLMGSLSDRFGRRPVLLVSLFGAGLDYFLLAWAPTLMWFFVGRVLAGITGANFSAAMAYIADVSPPEKRAANFGLVGAAFGLGFAVGPFIGGLLSDVGSHEFGLRLPFYVAGTLTLINWFYGLLVLPESLKDENRRAFSWKRSNPVGSLLAMRRYPMVLGLAFSYFLISVAHQVYPSTWMLYTDFRFDWTPKQGGYSLALVGLMAAIVQGGLARRLIPLWGEQKAAFIALVINVVAFIFYGLSTQGWMVYPVIIFGALGGIAAPAIQGMTANSVADNEQGGLQGMLSSLVAVAGIIGPLIATGLFEFFISEDAPFHLPGAAFFSSALIVAVAIVLAVIACRKQSSQSP